MHAARGFAVPLKMFAQHAHEGQPQLWTYLEDELFIETNPELREHLGQPVSILNNSIILYSTQTSSLDS